MRTLSGTLSARQKALEGLRPVIALEVSDRPVEIPRWDWTQRTSEAEASCHGAACVTSTGAVVRVRVNSAGALQVCRITDLVNGDWTGWSTLAAGPYSTSGQVAVGAATDAATVVIAYVDSTQRYLLYRVSTDGGVSWSGESALIWEPAGSSIKGVSLAGGAGYVYLAWTRDAGGAEPNDTLKVCRYQVGVGWGGTYSKAGLDTITACGVAVDGTTELVALGSGKGLLRLDFAWSTPGWVQAAPLTLVPAGAGAGYTLDVPRLVLSPDGSGRYYYTWLEAWTGNVPGSRYWFAASPERNSIGEGVIHDTNRGQGWDLLYRGDVWYAVCPVSHYSAPGYTAAATQKKDLGGDVVAFELVEEGPNRPSRGRIWLNNADGRYATPGTGTYAMVREGSRVALGLGYQTSAGAEKVWLPPLWIERWYHAEDVDGEACLVLEVGDAWSYLERCRARYQVTFTGQSYRQIVQALCYRVSADAVEEVGGLSIVAATFTIRPGESIGAVLRRVLGGAGVRLRFSTAAVSGDPGHWNAATVTAVAIGSGASGYAFGPAGHQVLRAEYADRGQPVSLVEVYGSGRWDYRHDLANQHGAGHTFVAKDADWQLDSNLDVGDRADRDLDEAQRQLRGGWIEVLPHLGAELYDVVDVTASRAGLAGAVRRVAGIRWRFDGRRRGVWLQRLELEGV